jgi:DNA-binding LacI/PurR family transcriptional regulator
MTFMQLDFVGAIMEAAAHADLDVLLSPSGGDHDPFFDRILTGGRVDGVILMEIRMTDNRVTRLRHTGTPFVTIGRTARPSGTCWVDIDCARLVAQCVDHLADLGHREVVLINRSADLLAAGYGPARRARQGFGKALVRRGIDGVEVQCDDHAQAGERCVEEILLAHPKARGIVTINEAALPGVRRALDRAGLGSPDRFSVTGIVARAWSEQFYPQLTAVDLPAEEMGATAVELLIERIAEPDAAPTHKLLVPPISLRASTGPAD